MTKPRFIKIKFDGWHTNAGKINDKKELALWLKDGSFQEGDFFVEVKAKFKVVKWKDGSLCYEETEEELP